MGKRTKLCREDLERWLEKQQAQFVGRQFSTKAKHKEEFVDWFMRVYEEALDS